MNKWPHIITKSDYARFKLAYEQGTKGITHLSSGVQDEDLCPECEGMSDEAFFSHSPCEICNRSLGGDRYIAHGIMDKGELIHLTVCPDCVYYMEYGTLDDETMERVEQNEETR